MFERGDVTDIQTLYHLPNASRSWATASTNFSRNSLEGRERDNPVCDQAISDPQQMPRPEFDREIHERSLGSCDPQSINLSDVMVGKVVAAMHDDAWKHVRRPRMDENVGSIGIDRWEPVKRAGRSSTDDSSRQQRSRNAQSILRANRVDEPIAKSSDGYPESLSDAIPHLVRSESKLEALSERDDSALPPGQLECLVVTRIHCVSVPDIGTAWNYLVSKSHSVTWNAPYSHSSTLG